jgi:hypothetical protein
MTTSRYEFALPSAQSIATLTIHKTTLVNVFLRFVTQSFVERMIAAILTERWVLSSVNRHYIPHKISDMYKYMAVTILLQGIEVMSHLTRLEKRSNSWCQDGVRTFQ